MKKTIYVYVLETMADWELAYVMPAINQAANYNLGEQRYQLKTVANTMEPIRTAGGLTVIPDCTVAEMEGEVAALILPGGDTWPEAQHLPILTKAVQYVNQEILVAAICGATLGLANMGVLDNKQHTSSSLKFLTGFSEKYQGRQFYQKELAVTDQFVITASPAGALAFARDILTHLKVFPEPMLTPWFKYYQTGDEIYYFQLMALNN